MSWSPHLSRWPRAATALALLMLPVVGMLTAAGHAFAYGNAGDAQQVYQLEVSGNCNNPEVCGDELGGFWAWAVLYDDGTGEAEFTGCAHGGEFTGAIHQHIDFRWVIENGFIVVTSETDVTVGHGPPTTDTIPDEEDPIAPAAAGHYDTAALFDLGLAPPPGPGVAFQIEVVALPVA